MFRIRKIGEHFFVERRNSFLWWVWWDSYCVQGDTHKPYPFKTQKEAKRWCKETFLKSNTTGVVDLIF